jgi:hypothetical protein
MFLPSLFVLYGMAAQGGASLLDRTLPERTDQPIVRLNAPSALPVHYFRRLREARTLAAAARPAVGRRLNGARE